MAPRIEAVLHATKWVWQATLAILVSVPLPVTARTPLPPMQKSDGGIVLSSGELLVWRGSQIQMRNVNGKWSKPVDYAPFLVASIWPQGIGRAAVGLAGNETKTNDGILKDELVGVEVKDASLSQVWRSSVKGHLVSGASDGQQVWILDASNLSTLDDAGKLAFVAKRELGETSLLPGGIVCKRYLPRKDQSPTEVAGARCRKANAWSFDGKWSMSEPILCGSWLLEPVEQQSCDPGLHKQTSGSSVRLRNIQSGTEVAQVRGHIGQLSCLPDTRVLDLGSQFVLSLPSLKKLGLARCGTGRVRKVTGTAGTAKKTGCLDTFGRPAFLTIAPL